MPTTIPVRPRDLPGAAKDLVYVTIGFGVLAVQRAQAQRRELTARLNDQLDAGKNGVEKVTGLVGQQIRTFENRLTAVEERVDAVLDQLESKLPEQARSAMHQARDRARLARDQVRGLTRRAA